MRKARKARKEIKAATLKLVRNQEACLAGMYTSIDTTLFACADCPAGKFQPIVGYPGCAAFRFHSIFRSTVRILV